MLTLFASACSVLTVQTDPEEATLQKAVVYQAVLGKSMNDTDVINFIASYNCSASGSFQLCRKAGLTFWTDSTQIVKTVYLYSGGVSGFKRYDGKLPFGLTFYDPMWLVEDKLKKLDIENTLQQAGLPDKGHTPDHYHYWAVYKRFNIVVIYDSPFADEDAYIYAILIEGDLSS